jgi:hypothetical protein
MPTICLVDYKQYILFLLAHKKASGAIRSRTRSCSQYTCGLNTRLAIVTIQGCTLLLVKHEYLADKGHLEGAIKFQNIVKRLVYKE